MFGPGSLTWRVNGEAVLLLGGGRALILQVAHPKVAAGVAEFSDYRGDPWGRLYRTLELTLAIVFGEPEASRQPRGGSQRVHARVAGNGRSRRALPGARPRAAALGARHADRHLADALRALRRGADFAGAAPLLRGDEDAGRGLRDPAELDARRLRRLPPLLGRDARRTGYGSPRPPATSPKWSCTLTCPARLARNGAPAPGHRRHPADPASRRAGGRLGARPRAPARRLAGRDPPPGPAPARAAPPVPRTPGGGWCGPP